jgi:hypothetical protein
MNMKKYFACAAALSLMVAACGDDTSSNANGGDPGTLSKKTGIAHAGDCSVFTPWEGEGEAFVIGSKGSGYQVLLPKMNYNVDLCDECLYERSGDTLHITDSDTMRVALNWFCTTDFTFDISDADADIKYFTYENSVYKIVKGPAPEKISSGMVVSSSSENPSSSESVKSSSSHGGSSAGQPESSSSVDPGSSSSVTPPSSSSKREYNGPVPLKSITAICHEEVWTNDPVEPEPPAAYFSVSNSFAQIDLLNVKLTYACDSALQKAFFDNLNADNTVASVIGDTLFVNIDRSEQKGVEFMCGCTADVKFTFDENYAVFGYTAFENNRPPLELEQRLINRPDPGYQKITKADAQCMGNESPDDPMVDAALPPVAHMHVNGDSAQVVIERVMVTCASIIESVEAQVKDSILYVTPHYDTTAPQADCICNTKVSFNVAARSPFTEATLLVYDDDPGNKMRLIVE